MTDDPKKLEYRDGKIEGLNRQADQMRADRATFLLVRRVCAVILVLTILYAVVKLLRVIISAE